MKRPGLNTFSSLSNSVFRIYFLGMMGQWFAMNMQMVARSLLVYRISGSGTALGLISLANAIPNIIFSFWGGAIADRIRKKNILLFSMLSSMLVSLAVALCLITGILSLEVPGSWRILIITAGLQGAITGLMMPARQSIISDIVEPKLLMNAISLNMMGMNTFRILAPAATGFLIAGFDFHTVYFIATGMYFLATIAMSRLPATEAPPPRKQSTIKDIIEGIKYIKDHHNTLYILVFTLVGMVCSRPYIELMPMITEDILMVGEEGMGILMSASGIGAIFGGLILASAPNRRRGFIMLTAGGLMGCGLVVFGFSSWWWVSLVAVIFIGLGQSSSRTTGNTLLQYYTEPEFRGRVMSFFMMETGFSGLGVFLAGILAEHIGVQWAIGGLGAVFILIAFSTLAFSPRLRELE